MIKMYPEKIYFKNLLQKVSYLESYPKHPDHKFENSSFFIHSMKKRQNGYSNVNRQNEYSENEEILYKIEVNKEGYYECLLNHEI